MRIKSFYLSLFLFLLLPPLTLIAQVDFSQVNDPRTSGTIFELIPQVPGPNERVTIRLENSDLNLDTALITWTVKGQKIKSGVGEKVLILQSGSAGSQTVVRVSIQNSSVALSDTIIIKPGDIDILWQGRGYVPPFYRGRNLWAKEGFITLTAIPHVFNSSGNEINRNSLIYKWTKDGSVLGASSGVGKNFLTFADSVLALPQNILIEVFDGDRIASSKSIQIESRNPKVLVYENHPLYGYLFNQEVAGKFELKKSEISFASFPYFFNTFKKNSPSLSYEWITNSSPNRPQRGGEVLYRITPEQSGASTIKVRVKNVNDILQSVSKDFLVQFKNENAF